MLAPPALRVAVVCPTQIVPLFTVTVGSGFTVTVVVPVAVQVPAVPVIVYTVVEAGLAVTLAPVVELSPVAGLQV